MTARARAQQPTMHPPGARALARLPKAQPQTGARLRPRCSPSLPPPTRRDSYGQRLGKACRLVDLAHSDARLKKSNYRELGLDSTVAKSRPNFGYIIFFNLASLFARSTRWHAFPNLWRGDETPCTHKGNLDELLQFNSLQRRRRDSSGLWSTAG